MTNAKYINPETFHKFINEVVGLKMGKNAIYEALARGDIRSIRTNTVDGARYQIPVNEVEDYPDRKLAESQGKPTVHRSLLGTRVQS